MRLLCHLDESGTLQGVWGLTDDSVASVYAKPSVRQVAQRRVALFDSPEGADDRVEEWYDFCDRLASNVQGVVWWEFVDTALPVAPSEWVAAVRA